MSGEIEVSETPNWLNDLEAKREKRLKARLGHEAGAGAPCLKCGDKCPGLDLHFWRKACKVCRCPKEEHDVPDDDIYGWAQFQLLGSKPNKIKTKIVLPGKNDEVELEWAPKGQKDTIDKYLNSLPPEVLPVKGSQAAQERKQLLQKQIPIHDIDPTLCHELNEDEITKMEEYIAHIKKSSVGVGQIVNLSSVIKANLHNISPQEAHVIASRYAKGIPFSEILKLQAGLAQNLEKLTLNNPKSINNPPALPAMHPNKLHGNIPEENMQNALPSSRYKDITHPWYTQGTPGKGGLNPQYSENFKARPLDQNPLRPGHNSDFPINEELLQGTNFDPSKTPSQFLGYRTPGYRAGQYAGQPLDGPYQCQSNQEGIGYDSTSAQPSTNISKNFNADENMPGPLEEGFRATPIAYGNVSVEGIQGLKPGFSQNLPGVNNKQHVDQYGFENPYFNQNRQDSKYTPESTTQKPLPEYSPAKHDRYSEIRDSKAPKNFKDLIYSTYDPSQEPIPQDQPENSINQRNRYPETPGYNSNIVFNTYKHDPSVIHHEPLSLTDKYDPALILGKHTKTDQQDKFGPQGLDPKRGLRKFDPLSGKYVLEEHRNPFDYKSDSSTQRPGMPKFDPVTGKFIPEEQVFPESEEYAYDPSDSRQYGKSMFDPKTGQYISEDMNPASTNKYAPDAPYEDSTLEPLGGNENQNPYTGYSQFTQREARKPLSTLKPGHINVPEDYLEPHMVNVGAIQDINPEIRAATTELNPGFDKDSVYSDNGAEYSPESIREILNNIKLPDCHYCKKPFEENEFAVTIDRANVLFHAQCFKCAGCNQSLADNIYFYHKESNNVYCGRDYAKIKGYPRCSACDELIFTKEYCLAENATFHLKHFCCFQCDIPLAGQDYTLEDEKPYCLPCYESSKAAKCSTCEKIIKPEEVGCQLNGVHFHADDKCFRCIVCSLPMMGKKLLLRNEKLYCSHDCFNTGKK